MSAGTGVVRCGCQRHSCPCGCPDCRRGDHPTWTEDERIAASGQRREAIRRTNEKARRDRQRQLMRAAAAQ